MTNLWIDLHRRFASCLLWVAASLAMGCSQEPSVQPTKAASQAETQAEIAWFKGTVEEAFAHAAANRKPLFLYWGATWCPPCNQLKSTVFTRPDFVAQTQRYVAFRLDGDDPAAQRWAAHFGAMGYPTLIVFDAQGQERTRLSSGMQLERYAQVLETAPQSRDLSTLIALWRQQRLADWSAADWEQVAYYPWGAEPHGLLEDAERKSFFAELHAAQSVPTPALDRRLLLLWATEVLRASEPEPLLQGRKGQFREELRAILSNPAEWQASLDWLQYSGVDWIAAISSSDEQRKSLLAELQSVMEQVWSDENYSLKTRLLTLRSRLDAAALNYPQQPPAAPLVALVERRTAQITEQAQTPYERQSLMYNAAWYLREVGQSSAAAELLQSELETAVAPHYYMSYLGRFAQDQGDIQEALNWYQRAFVQAHGSATRMQWGLAYLQSLLELAPADEPRIYVALESLQQIAQEAPNSLYQRSRVRLQRLQTPLAQWTQASKRRREVLAEGRQQWQAVCEQLEASSAAAQTCAAFWPST
nr:thioredoxin family protein [Oceanococcus sp. HetDA_MAG_MS8]